MPVMNVELPDGMHRRLAATAAACGVSMKEAVVEAAGSWIKQHAAEAAVALGFSPAQDAAPKADAKRRAPPATVALARMSPPVVVVVPPRAPDAPVEVAAPAPVAGEPVEPTSGVDRWMTADELLRDDGHPDCQHGVLIGAGVSIRGAAVFTVESEEASNADQVR